MNSVSLIGRVMNDPELTVDRSGRDECFLQVEVPRRDRSGNLVPGVIYVDVTTFGAQARECADSVSAAEWIGINGTLEREDSVDARGPRRSRWEVHAHQVQRLEEQPSTTSDLGGA
jgi:single-stranded DNA-binding protein